MAGRKSTRQRGVVFWLALPSTSRWSGDFGYFFFLLAAAAVGGPKNKKKKKEERKRQTYWWLVIIVARGGLKRNGPVAYRPGDLQWHIDMMLSLMEDHRCPSAGILLLHRPSHTEKRDESAIYLIRFPSPLFFFVRLFSGCRVDQKQISQRVASWEADSKAAYFAYNWNIHGSGLFFYPKINSSDCSMLCHKTRVWI